MATFIQWNRANYNELEILIGTFRPVAFCLQELLVPDSYVFQNRQYTFLKKLPATDGNSNTRPNGGAGILIRKDIAHSALAVNSPLQAVACRISLPQPVTLCSIYLPPTSSWSHADLLSLVSDLPSPVILMGDFNGVPDGFFGSPGGSRSDSVIENRKWGMQWLVYPYDQLYSTH